MADSNITKRALAAALKELMTEMPFSKISVSDICEKCEMNRKSFYYHFKDKFELVNWIFDTEFLFAANREDGWCFLADLCRHMYDNRQFYRKALKIEGQNSFSDHFHEMLQPVVSEYMKDLIQPPTDQLNQQITAETEHRFYTHFLTDGVVSAIERWLLGGSDLNAEDFLMLIQSCIVKMAVRAYHKYVND